MTKHSSGLLTAFRESASDTPAQLPHHLSCTNARPGTTASRANCRKIQQWTNDLNARLEAHQAGRGARLMEVVKAAGITWRLARTWPGSRDRERAIKNRHEAPRLCPECSPVPRPVNAGRSAGQAGPGRHAAAARPPQVRQEPLLRAVAADLISDPWQQAEPPGSDLGDAEIEAG